MLNVYMLLDRSGSMSNKWEETLGAVNAYVNALAESKVTEDAQVTLAAFDGGGSTDFKVLRRSVPANYWENVVPTEVSPRGMTPLFDAIQLMAALINADAPEAASIVFLTDGGENGSREVSKDGAKLIVEGFKNKLYDVVFIGAEFDAFGQSGGLGIGGGQTLNMDKGGYAAAAGTMAMRSMNYSTMFVDGGISAQALSTLDFTDRDRKSAAGK